MNERPYAAVYCKDDARWLELVDAQAEGEFLTAADHQFLEAHQAVHPDVRAEQEIWHSLRAFDPSLIAVTRDDDALISAAVEAFLAAPMISDAHDEAPEADAGGQVVELFAKPSFLARWRAPTLWAGAGAAVAASVMFVFLTGSGRQDASTIAPQVAQANSQVGDAPSTATASDREFGFTGEKSELLAQAVVPSGLVVVSGHGSQNGKALRKRSSIARTGQEIQVAETMCIAANDAQEICLEQGSRALVRANSLELLSGKIRYRGRDDIAPTTSMQVFNVEVAGVQFAAKTGVYEVVTASDVESGMSVFVESGDVAVGDGKGHLIASLSTGDRFQPGKRGRESESSDRTKAPSDAAKPASVDKPSVVRADTKAQIERARGLLRNGKLQEAAKAYEKLVSQDGQSALGRAAMVSLGQLYAERLSRPKDALRVFDAYLQGGAGPLAEEAWLGKIESLHALGRTTDERKAIEVFLTRYPSSSYSDRLRSRLR